MRDSRRRHSGFTLIETLAAGTILALSAAMIGTAVSQSINSLETAREYQRAGQLLNQTFTKIDLIGPERLQREGPLEGQFEMPDDKFSWETEVESRDIGHLYSVTVRIRWTSYRGPHVVEAQTLLNDAPSSRNASVQWSQL